MPRKIVIIPTFASSHLLKYWIPNVIEVLNPDVIIINEGLFPNGPEDKGHVDSYTFKRKYLYREDGMELPMGFDWSETCKILYEYQYKHNGRPLIVSMGMTYKSSNVDDCFIQCMTNFPKGFLDYHGSDVVIEPGDLIFPLEPDAFHHEKDIAIINEHLNKLQPGQGLKTRWVDFIETQYYTEAINIEQPKYRRFAYCFDNMGNYKEAINGFKSQNYPKLKQVDDFITYHYPWFTFGKWKELRFDLIHRSDPQYWKDFEKGLWEIRKVSMEKIEVEEKFKSIGLSTFGFIENTGKNKIIIRPSRHDEGRWAKFIDIDHPKHIQSHPNFVK